MNAVKIFLILLVGIVVIGFVAPLMVSSQTDIGPITVGLVGLGIISFVISKLTKKEKKTDEKVS